MASITLLGEYSSFFVAKSSVTDARLLLESVGFVFGELSVIVLAGLVFGFSRTSGAWSFVFGVGEFFRRSRGLPSGELVVGDESGSSWIDVEILLRAFTYN